MQQPTSPQQSNSEAAGCTAVRSAHRRALRWLTAIGAVTLATALLADVETAEVEIRGSQFIPATLTVVPGTTVRWTNAEKRTSHSILFPEEGGLESERFFPGESWQRRFERPGRYRYTCGPHPEMHGEVIVTE
ncbi:MAG: plastocyanin [Gammaproteobacteria bacterium]|nr:plastocyanin [Gammaproteobacteria bacterium]